LKDVKTLNLGENYLEIGAGPGLLAIAIAEDNPHVHIIAVDISSDMVTVANEYIRANRLQDIIQYYMADANDEDNLSRLGKFDLVYTTFSMHHWKEPVKSISNLWNAVKNDGTLYIYDFKSDSWLSYLPLSGGDKDSIRASYSTSEVRVMLQKSGITNYRIKTPFPFVFQSVIARK
jgi:ubiquinone/menaquinone biosynthesis C-methylase UbiE